MSVPRTRKRVASSARDSASAQAAGKGGSQDSEDSLCNHPIIHDFPFLGVKGIVVVLMVALITAGAGAGWTLYQVSEMLWGEGSPPSVPINAPYLEGTFNDRHSQRRKGNMTHLKEWFVKNGGKLHPNISLRQRKHDPEDWGLFASGPVKHDDILCYVPSHLVVLPAPSALSLMSNLERLRNMSSLSAEELTQAKVLEVVGLDVESVINGTELVGSFISLVEEARWSTQLSLLSLYLLIHADNPEHFLYPYISTLPTGCLGPVCWSKEKLAEYFTPSYVESLVEEHAGYAKVAVALGLPVEPYMRYVSVIISRTWAVTRPPKTVANEDGEVVEVDPDDILVLVPILDLFNHHPWSDASVNFPLQTLSPTATHKDSAKVGPYKLGDEVFISYGGKSNADLLEIYGILVPENPHDACSELQEYLLPSIVTSIKLVGGARCPPPQPKRDLYRDSFLSSFPFLKRFLLILCFVTLLLGILVLGYDLYYFDDEGCLRD